MSDRSGAAPATEASEAGRPQRAGGSPGAWATLVVTTGVALVLDLWSKSLAFATVAGAPVTVRREDVLSASSLDSLIPQHEPVTVVPKLLEFTLVLNPGAVFGVGAGRRVFFIVFTLLALGFALFVFARWTSRRDRVAHVALALLVAGGLGNLFDRMVFACVRDFIHPLPGVRLPFGIAWPSGSRDVWPYVSNVADLFLLIGIGTLLVCSWRAGGNRETRDSRPDRADDPPSGR